MVYGSLPAYLDLDPPLSWITEHLLTPGTPRSGQPAGSDAHPDQLPPRPGSTAEREIPRLPKLVHQPDQPLNCPRCDSTNTKFCYFNNYSLSQPRHFCKTCRRYWTRGGALRNVPVGGGCRRNKRGKITASKSSTNSSNNHHTVTPPTPSGLTSTSSSTTGVGAITSSSSHMLLSTIPQFPAMSSSTNVVGLEYGGGGILQGAIGQMSGAPISSYGYGGLEQWRSQFSFFSGLDQMITSAPPSTGILNPFNANGNATPSGLIKQHDPPLKMDETSQQRLNMPRQYLGNTSSVDDDHYSWGYGGSRSLWTDLSGFNPSSTNNLL